MNKSDLISRIAANTDMTQRDVGAIIDQMGIVITNALKNGERVSMPLLGSFSTQLKESRKGRNPKTGEEIIIGQSIKPRFSPSTALKNALNIN